LNKELIEVRRLGESSAESVSADISAKAEMSAGETLPLEVRAEYVIVPAKTPALAL
jgi:hypothetical protein